MPEASRPAAPHLCNDSDLQSVRRSAWTLQTAGGIGFKQSQIESKSHKASRRAALMSMACKLIVITANRPESGTPFLAFELSIESYSNWLH